MATDTQLTPQEIARMVGQVRERRGMTYRAMGTWLGIPPTCLHDWEKGRRSPRNQSYRRAIVRAYNSTVGQGRANSSTP